MKSNGDESISLCIRTFSSSILARALFTPDSGLNVQKFDSDFITGYAVYKGEIPIAFASFNDYPVWKGTIQEAGKGLWGGLLNDAEYKMLERSRWEVWFEKNFDRNGFDALNTFWLTGWTTCPTFLDLAEDALRLVLRRLLRDFWNIDAVLRLSIDGTAEELEVKSLFEALDCNPGVDKKMMLLRVNACMRLDLFSQVIVRKGRVEDYDEVKKLFDVETNPDLCSNQADFKLAEILQNQKADDNYVFIVEEGGDVVGMLWITTDMKLLDGKTLERSFFLDEVNHFRSAELLEHLRLEKTQRIYKSLVEEAKDLERKRRAEVREQIRIGKTEFIYAALESSMDEEQWLKNIFCSYVVSLVPAKKEAVLEKNKRKKKKKKRRGRYEI